MPKIKTTSAPKFEKPIMVTTKGTSARPRFTARCGDCLFFQGAAHPAYEEPCKELGRLTKGVAPPCFSPNVNKLSSSGVQFVEALSVLVKRLNVSQIRVLGSIFLTSDKVRQTGYELLEEVYFAIGTDKYLTNYYRGFVVGAGSSKEQVLVLGANRTGKKLITAQLFGKSLLRKPQFDTVRDKLAASGKLYDPRITKRRPKIKAPTTYTPPMLDSDPEKLEALASPGKRGASRTAKSKNVSLVIMG